MIEHSIAVSGRGPHDGVPGLFVEESQINDPVLSEGTSVTQFSLDTSPLSSLPESETENPI